ncbi:MAG: helix-turn-helix transcriptional regulator [Bythopirellula sp.]|nr:helix-turn-helix transcriptional regulator [Bythopirellula sp.]
MFGDILKKARLKAGMTQEQLAFEADVDRTFLSRLENNRMSPTLETLFRLSDALGVPASLLIARVERSWKRK